MNSRHREIARTPTATGWVFILAIMLIAACALIFGCHSEEEYIESMVVPEVPAPEKPVDLEREPAEERDPVEEPTTTPGPSGTPVVPPPPLPIVPEPVYQNCEHGPVVLVGETCAEPPPPDPLTVITGTIGERFQEGHFKHKMEPNIPHCLLFEKTSKDSRGCTDPILNVFLYETGAVGYTEKIYEVIDNTPEATFFHWAGYRGREYAYFVVKDWGAGDDSCYPYTYRFVHYPSMLLLKRDNPTQSSEYAFEECDFEKELK